MGREGRNFKPSATPQVQIAEKYLEENKIHEEPEIASAEKNMTTAKSRQHIRLASIVRDNSQNIRLNAKEQREMGWNANTYGRDYQVREAKENIKKVKSQLQIHDFSTSDVAHVMDAAQPPKIEP